MVSCDGDIKQHADMYGTPTADYEVKGKVLDADGDPIKGIKITMIASGNHSIISVSPPYEVL